MTESWSGHYVNKGLTFDIQSRANNKIQLANESLNRCIIDWIEVTMKEGLPMRKHVHLSIIKGC